MVLPISIHIYNNLNLFKGQLKSNLKYFLFRQIWNKTYKTEAIMECYHTKASNALPSAYTRKNTVVQTFLSFSVYLVSSGKQNWFLNILVFSCMTDMVRQTEWHITLYPLGYSIFYLEKWDLLVVGVRPISLNPLPALLLLQILLTILCICYREWCVAYRYITHVLLINIQMEWNVRSHHASLLELWVMRESKAYTCKGFIILQFQWLLE